MLEKIKTVIDNVDALGPIMLTTKAAPLTESEAEFTVQVIKHMFQQFVVLEFYVTNTLQGVALENVQVVLTPSDQQKFQVLGTIPVEKVAYNENKSCYAILQKLNLTDLVCTDNIRARLTFEQLDEGDDIGYPDDSVLENVAVAASDYVTPAPLPQGQVQPLFQQLGQHGQAMTKVQLEYRGLDAAVAGVIAALNMEPCDKSDQMTPGKVAQELWLSGTFAGGVSVAVRALIGVDKSGRILMQLVAASKKKEVAECVTRFLD